MCTVVQNTFALGVAVLLNRKMRGRNFYRAVMFLPSILGVTIVSLIWSLFLNASGGEGKSLLSLVGGSSAFFGDYHVAFALVIFVQIWSSAGYSMLIFLAGLQTVPEDLIEAATIDGSNAWRRFRHVTLPIIRPAITANVLLSIIGGMQAYQYVYVLTSGGFNTNVLAFEVFSTTFGNSIGEQATVVQQQGYASAISMIQFVMIAVIALTALLYLRRREIQL